MATSNRDRVGRGFELLAEGLRPFVDRQMAASMPAGADWAAVIQARDTKDYKSIKALNKDDPQILLKVLAEERQVFGRRLSGAEQAFAPELIAARNAWAHNQQFSADDTYRVLDTLERLLAAVGAAGGPPAGHVRGGDPPAG